MNRLTNLRGEIKHDHVSLIQSIYHLRAHNMAATAKLLREKNFLYKPDQV